MYEIPCDKGNVQQNVQHNSPVWRELLELLVKNIGSTHFTRSTTIRNGSITDAESESVPDTGTRKFIGVSGWKTTKSTQAIRLV
jgi:hypothetical protein